MNPTDEAHDHELAALLAEVRALRHDLAALKASPAIGRAVATGPACEVLARSKGRRYPPDYEVLVKAERDLPPDYMVLVRYPPDYEVLTRAATAPEEVGATALFAQIAARSVRGAFSSISVTAAACSIR